MNESKNVKKNVSMMLTGMVIGAALTGGSIAVAAGITAEPTWQPIFVDGQQVEMQAYNIAGHNYVKLRDMGKQVGFNVYWNAGVQIDTGHPYTGIAPAASGIRVSSYKGSTLRPGDRSGLNISPSEEIKSVVSTQPNVIRVENASGFWTAIAVSSGTSDVVVTDPNPWGYPEAATASHSTLFWWYATRRDAQCCAASIRAALAVSSGTPFSRRT